MLLATLATAPQSGPVGRLCGRYTPPTAHHFPEHKDRGVEPGCRGGESRVSGELRTITRRHTWPPVAETPIRCKDGAYALIAGNGDSIFKRLMALIGRTDLANDPMLGDNAGRVARVEEIDKAIETWTLHQSVDDVLQALEGVSVPAGKIYSIADIASDPHYAARGMLQEITLADGSDLKVPGVVPKLSATPGHHRRNAPELGQDTNDILQEIGLTLEQIQKLKASGIVGGTA